MYCDFDKMFIAGVEILNDVFLYGILNSNDWKVNILEHKRDFKFHFDTNVSIRKVDKIEDDADLIFIMSYDKKEVYLDKPTIVSWVEEENFDKKEFINISNSDAVKRLEGKEKFSLTKIENQSKAFIECIQKIEGDLDV